MLQTTNRTRPNAPTQTRGRSIHQAWDTHRSHLVFLERHEIHARETRLPFPEWVKSLSFAAVVTMAALLAEVVSAVGEASSNAGGRCLGLFVVVV